MSESSQFSEEKYNKMKQTEADLVRDLQAIVKDPSKEADLGDDVFKKHQNWLRIIMPNYSSKIHLGIVDAYDKILATNPIMMIRLVKVQPKY